MKIIAVLIILFVFLVAIVTAVEIDCFDKWPGDSNGDGRRDISDPITINNWLFLGSVEPTCLGNSDANNDKRVDLSDVIYLLQWLFKGGVEPVFPQLDENDNLPEIAFISVSPEDVSEIFLEEGIPTTKINLRVPYSLRVIDYSSSYNIKECTVIAEDNGGNVFTIFESDWVINEESQISRRLGAPHPILEFDVTSDELGGTINTEYLLTATCEDILGRTSVAQLRIFPEFVEVESEIPTEKELFCRDGIDRCCLSDEEEEVYCLRDTTDGEVEPPTCEEFGVEIYGKPKLSCEESGGVCCICEGDDCVLDFSPCVTDVLKCTGLDAIGPAFEVGAWREPKDERESTICDGQDVGGVTTLSQVPVSICNLRPEPINEDLSNKNGESPVVYLQNEQDGWGLDEVFDSTPLLPCNVKYMTLYRKPEDWLKLPAEFTKKHGVRFYTSSELGRVNTKIENAFPNRPNLRLWETTDTDQYNERPLGHIEGWDYGSLIRPLGRNGLYQQGNYKAGVGFAIRAVLVLGSSSSNCPEAQFAQSESYNKNWNGPNLQLLKHSVTVGREEGKVSSDLDKNYMYTKDELLLDKSLRLLKRERKLPDLTNEEVHKRGKQTVIPIGIEKQDGIVESLNPGSLPYPVCDYNSGIYCFDGYVGEEGGPGKNRDSWDTVIKLYIAAKLHTIPGFTMSGSGNLNLWKPEEIVWHDTPLAITPVKNFISRDLTSAIKPIPSNYITERKNNFISIIEDSHPIAEDDDSSSEDKLYLHRWVCEYTNVNVKFTYNDATKKRMKLSEDPPQECICYQQKANVDDKSNLLSKWEKIEDTQHIC
jgi:hypothetical protein